MKEISPVHLSSLRKSFWLLKSAGKRWTVKLVYQPVLREALDLSFSCLNGLGRQTPRSKILRAWTGNGCCCILVSWNAAGLQDVFSWRAVWMGIVPYLPAPSPSSPKQTMKTPFWTKSSSRKHWMKLRFLLAAIWTCVHPSVLYTLEFLAGSAGFGDDQLNEYQNHSSCNLASCKSCFLLPSLYSHFDIFWHWKNPIVSSSTLQLCCGYPEWLILYRGQGFAFNKRPLQTNDFQVLFVELMSEGTGREGSRPGHCEPPHQRPSQGAGGRVCPGRKATGSWWMVEVHLSSKRFE